VGENAIDIFPLLLLVSLGFALSIGMGFVVLLVRRKNVKPGKASAISCPYERTCSFRRPGCWLAVKACSPKKVQAALGLHDARPCSWTEGLAEERKLFISPLVKGWVLVMGSRLPEPSEDVDVCFRFLLEMSRKLGHVQFFSVNRALHHHAWAQASRGRIVRAYAWAGRTLWTQGRPTAAEKELEFKCFDYGEAVERSVFNQADLLDLNVDKVALLAGRWSLDPSQIDEQLLEADQGIAGELARRY
jgi:hypothetical protein